jgi:hypothetical protein
MRGAKPPLLYTQTLMPQEEFETMTQMFDKMKTVLACLRQRSHCDRHQHA